MNGKEYLAKFSCAVRWRLSASQAEEVISDYTEMLSQSTSEEDIEKKWGNPYEAARLLGEPKAYRAWLVVFALLMVCLFLPVFWMFSSAYDISYIFTCGVLFLGIGVCFYGFRPPLNKCVPCPKKLIYTVILLCFIDLAAMGLFSKWYLMAIDPATNISDGKMFIRTIKLWGLIAVAAGMWGVFQARTRDYRWRALYVLGVATLLMVFSIYHVFTGMNLDAPFERIFYTFVSDWCIYGAVGLIGAVLCLRKI